MPLDLFSEEIRPQTKPLDLFSEETVQLQKGRYDWLTSGEHVISPAVQRMQTEGGQGIKQSSKKIGRGFQAFGHDLLRGTQSFWKFFDDAATLVSRATGLEKGGVFEALKEMGEPPKEWAPKDLAERVVGGIAAAIPEIGKIATFGRFLPGGVTTSMATIGAVHGGAEGGLKQAAYEATKGALLGQVLKGAAQIPKPFHAPTVGGIFAGQAAVEGGTPEEIAEAGAVGVGLGLLGGKERVKRKRPVLSKKVIKSLDKTEQKIFAKDAKQHGPEVAVSSIMEHRFRNAEMQIASYLKKGDTKKAQAVYDKTVANINKLTTIDGPLVDMAANWGIDTFDKMPAVQKLKAFQEVKTEAQAKKPIVSKPETEKAQTLYSYGDKEVEPYGIPETPSKQFTPSIQGPTRAKMIKTLEKQFDIPIKYGKLMSRRNAVKGEYQRHAEVIRLRKANDIETTVHETAHHFEKLLNLPKTMPEEVRRFAYEGAKDLNREGFAEFVRHYVTQPEKAKTGAPDFYNKFEMALDINPDVKDVIIKVRQQWHEFQQLPAAEKVGSYIVSSTEKKGLPTFSEIYTSLKDELYPLKILVNTLKKEKGVELKPSEDPFILATLLRGWARKAEQYTKHGTFQLDPVKGARFTGKSLREILEPVEKSGERHLLDRYLVANRAVNDPRVLEGFKGQLTVEDFQKTAEKYQKSYGKIAEDLYKYSDELLTYLTDSGRISKKVANTIREKNLFYAPLYRVVDIDPSLKGLSKVKTGNLFNPIKRLKGSSRDIYSPTESMLYNTYAMLNIAERNRVGKALVKLSQVEGMGKFMRRIPFPIKPVKMTMQEAVKSFAEKMGVDLKTFSESMPKDILSEFVTTFRPAIKAGPNEAIFYVDGKPFLFELSPDLYRSIMATDSQSINGLIKFLSMPAKVLRAGATTFSLEFPARNIVRDQLTAFVQSKYGYVPVKDFTKGLFHMFNKTELWQKYNASGAAHAALVSMDRSYLSKNLKKLMSGKGVKGIIRNPLELMQIASEYAEEATRVGEFVKGFKKEGGDLEGLLKAGVAGREVTLDFSRKGASRGVKDWNLISAFFNARLEGIDKIARTLKEGVATPKAAAKLSTKLFLGITLPSLITWWYQKDDPYYQEIPTWRRALFWNYVFHNKDGSLDKIVSIPKPFEWGILFGSVPETIAEYIYSEDPDIMNETMSQLAEGIAPDVLPTAATPFVEWYANRNIFFDRPIVPRSKEGIEPVMQYSPYTSETVKLVARMMDKIPGLKEVASPAKIENLMLGYTAGAGRLALEQGDWLLETLGAIEVPPEPTKKISELPLFRAFSQRFPSASTRSIERFYKEYEDLERKTATIKEKAGIRGWGVKTGSLSEQLEKYRAAKNVLSLCGKMANEVYESKTLEPDQKREYMDNLYMAMINTARVALEKEQLPVQSQTRGGKK